MDAFEVTRRCCSGGRAGDMGIVCLKVFLLGLCLFH